MNSQAASRRYSQRHANGTVTMLTAPNAKWVQSIHWGLESSPRSRGPKTPRPSEATSEMMKMRANGL
jgi:hypothetical protein